MNSFLFDFDEMQFYDDNYTIYFSSQGLNDQEENYEELNQPIQKKSYDLSQQIQIDSSNSNQAQNDGMIFHHLKDSLKKTHQQNMNYNQDDDNEEENQNDRTLNQDENPNQNRINETDQQNSNWKNQASANIYPDFQQQQLQINCISDEIQQQNVDEKLEQQSSVQSKKLLSNQYQNFQQIKQDIFQCDQYKNASIQQSELIFQICYTIQFQICSDVSNSYFRSKSRFKFIEEIQIPLSPQFRKQLKQFNKVYYRLIQQLFMQFNQSMKYSKVQFKEDNIFAQLLILGQYDDLQDIIIQVSFELTQFFESLQQSLKQYDFNNQKNILFYKETQVDQIYPQKQLVREIYEIKRIPLNENQFKLFYQYTNGNDLLFCTINQAPINFKEKDNEENKIILQDNLIFFDVSECSNLTRDLFVLKKNQSNQYERQFLRINQFKKLQQQINELTELEINNYIRQIIMVLIFLNKNDFYYSNFSSDCFEIDEKKNLKMCSLFCEKFDHKQQQKKMNSQILQFSKLIKKIAAFKLFEGQNSQKNNYQQYISLTNFAQFCENQAGKKNGIEKILNYFIQEQPDQKKNSE